jgi:hypothetical protein
MIDFFDNIYNSITDKKPFLRRIRYYSLLRFFTRISLNILLRIDFLVATKNSLKNKVITKNEGRIVVSLTSFPARIKNVWLAIESLMRQTVPPDKIILWLAKNQFDGFQSLPKSLLKLVDRGLEIRFCDEDLRSHKKYYFALQEFPKDFIVTTDDDIIYPSYMLDQLIELNKLYPSCICCHRAITIKTRGNDIAPYSQWELLRAGTEPSFKIFQTSGGGTLFPPNSLHKEVLNKEVFMKYCLYADDIWLNVMSQYNNVKIAKTDSYIQCLPVINFNSVTLHSINNLQGYNDLQIASLREYYLKHFEKDVFSNLFNV